MRARFGMKPVCQIAHGGIDDREACLPLSPRGKRVSIVAPRKHGELSPERFAHHDGEVM